MVLLIGLDGAGKTTILYRIKLADTNNHNRLPTIGLPIETAEYKNFAFTVWDHGGQDKIRPLWRHYYLSTKAIIWTIDSNDIQRFIESKQELIHLICNEPELKNNVPLLIYANKQDLDCMSITEIVDKLFICDDVIDDESNQLQIGSNNNQQNIFNKPKLNNIERHYEFDNIRQILFQIFNQYFNEDETIHINKSICQLIVDYIPCKAITAKIGERDFCILPTIAKTGMNNNIVAGLDWIDNKLNGNDKNCFIM